MNEYKRVYLSKPNTCSNCTRVIQGDPVLQEDSSNNNIDSKNGIGREFCCTECLQKYRLKEVQIKKHLQMQQEKLNKQHQSKQMDSPSNSSLNSQSHEPTSNLEKKIRELKANIDSNGSEAKASLSSNGNNGDALSTSLSVSSTKDISKQLKTTVTSSSSTPLSLKEPKNKDQTSGPSSTPRPTHSSPSSTVPSLSASSSKSGKVTNYHYETFSIFDWDDYLAGEKGKPAPRSYFKQALIPPENDFVQGMKLEARDPRNPSSSSIATVVALIGSRIQLRLDGSDNTNDFFELVDSASIAPFGSCEKRGDMLQPPLGFRRNPSQWPMFVVQQLQGATLAPDDCFKPEPKDPKENRFEVGMKLEAVDRKNPRLICPATVGAVKDNQIQICFDGWKGAFDYWCDFRSRDIFPVKWCQESGHPLQPPGNKVPTEAKKAKQMSASSLVVNSKNNQLLATVVRGSLKKNNKTDVTSVDATNSVKKTQSLQVNGSSEKKLKDTKNSSDTKTVSETQSLNKKSRDEIAAAKTSEPKIKITPFDSKNGKKTVDDKDSPTDDDTVSEEFSDGDSSEGDDYRQQEWHPPCLLCCQEGYFDSPQTSELGPLGFPVRVVFCGHRPQGSKHPVIIELKGKKYQCIRSPTPRKILGTHFDRRPMTAIETAFKLTPKHLHVLPLPASMTEAQVVGLYIKYNKRPVDATMNDSSTKRLKQETHESQRKLLTSQSTSSFLSNKTKPNHTQTSPSILVPNSSSMTATSSSSLLTPVSPPSSSWTTTPSPKTPSSSNPSVWETEEVIGHLVSVDPSLAKHEEIFRTHVSCLFTIFFEAITKEELIFLPGN